MTVVDLTTAPQPASGLLAAPPERTTLTLGELRLAASLAGDAPLPWGPAGLGEAPLDHRLDHRLGAGDSDPDRTAYARARAALPEPGDSLRRRGLLADGGVDDTLAGALALLATPHLAVDLDVAVAGSHARSWHRQAGDLVVSLATLDGLVFELTWFGTRHWADELARVVALPADLALGDSTVPPVVELPYELADAAGEALRHHRGDLLAELVSRWPGQVVGADAVALDPAEVVALLEALHREAQGRLRVLAAAGRGPRSPVAVASWVLVGGGWRSVRPAPTGGADRAELRGPAPDDLARELGPLLAGVGS